MELPEQIGKNSLQCIHMLGSLLEVRRKFNKNQVESFFIIHASHFSLFFIGHFIKAKEGEDNSLFIFLSLFFLYFEKPNIDQCIFFFPPPRVCILLQITMLLLGQLEVAQFMSGIFMSLSYFVSCQSLYYVSQWL